MWVHPRRRSCFVVFGGYAAKNHKAIVASMLPQAKSLRIPENLIDRVIMNIEKSLGDSPGQV